MKIRYRFIGLLALLFLAAGSPGAAAADHFLSAIDDLPLMAGLNEVDGGAMVFDSPAGRIVEALATGKVAREEVSRYYSETLPQLGWLETAPGRFSREGEMLKLEFPRTEAVSGSAASVLNVRFMLSPVQ